MALKAMTSVRSEEDLLRIARDLDNERISKGSRGPLHGIPVIMKVANFQIIACKRPLRTAGHLQHTKHRA